MRFTGKFVNVLRDWQTGQCNITFTLNEDSALTGIDKIKDIDKLIIEAKKYREKRSLDSNAYAWVLMTKIAAELGSTKEEIYEEMLRKYGFLYESDDGIITITVKSNVDMSKISGHWQFIKDNGSFKAYAMIKGSSEYDTKEMSHFINGIVEDAKELGIDTMSPEEIRQMNERWGLSKDCGQF